MTQSISRQNLINKWTPIIESAGVTGSKSDWMSEWAEIHSKNVTSEKSEFLSILPIARKIASQTIGLDLVSVQPLSSPMSMGNSEEEMRRIESEIKSENREGKIESVLEGKEFKEKTVKDHPDYKEGGLLYFDYNYNSGKKTRRAGKKHKKKNGSSI